MKFKRLHLFRQLCGEAAALFSAILLSALPVQAASGIPAALSLKKASDNPIFKTDGAGKLIFTADPAVLVEGETMYVYAGQDEARLGGWFSMNQWVCFSSTNAVNWNYEGVVLKAADFSWGTRGTAWAAQVVKKNGRYYFYSSTGRPNRQGFSVGVAVADRPTGPFVDVKKAPVFENAITTGGATDSFEDIDPTVLIDDSGIGHLYWGNGKLHYAQLADDMMSVRDLNGDGQITEGVDIITGVPIAGMEGAYGEAPWVFEDDGRFYLVYASGLPQKIRYAMADSPRGPWRYKGVILDENLRPDGSRTDSNSDTSHPAVVKFKGQWYLFYHTAAQPTGGQTRRSVSVEKLAINPDGTIQRAFITSTGVSGQAARIEPLSQPGQFVRFQKFELTVEAPHPVSQRAFLWELSPGLMDEAPANAVAIQCVSHPGYYLVLDGNRAVLGKNDHTPEFKRRATFRALPGLADPTGVSFESLADSTRFLHVSDGRIAAGEFPVTSGAADRRAATFRLDMP